MLPNFKRYYNIITKIMTTTSIIKCLTKKLKFHNTFVKMFILFSTYFYFILF